jgi:DNA excision repair protein ERCC-4
MPRGLLANVNRVGNLLTRMARVTALSLEAFIVRLYREKNKAGFLKAFTDQPEHITSGMSPLKNIMKELQLRTVHIYPRSVGIVGPRELVLTLIRFHEDIKQSLERRRADVIELYQPMTESMAIIHEAIVQCITSTLSDLKRSSTTVILHLR